MIRPGLCSVAFRALDALEVAEIAAEAGLDGIEWGADVHVPPGALDQASRVADRCATLGLACPSYGSYLCAGDLAPGCTEPALDTALALGCANVRVWAGRRASADTGTDGRDRVVADLTELTAEATARGLTVSVEHHAGTLTDTLPSSLDLLGHVEGLWTHWQPRDGVAGGADLAELEGLLAHLGHVHVFWWRHFADRSPLADGEAFWREALAAADRADRWRGERWAFLEFVRGDDPAQLLEDAGSLRSWLP